MILVVGGAGYIGSHIVKELLDKNYNVVVLDNLSTGHRQAVDKRVELINGDLGDESLIDRIFRERPIKAVMHLAANSLVGESIENPRKYYENNVIKTMVLLNTMIKYDIRFFIFSSSAAVYGNKGNNLLLSEEDYLLPINPYGRSKHIIEQVLDDYYNAYGLNYVSLRYFNAAGADDSGDIGECHNPETHLIPLILQHLMGTLKNIVVFGTDYDTPDGSCIRDYVHVSDLAHAHILSLEYILRSNHTNSVYNIGSGKGYSVFEVIQSAEKITGRKATIFYGERRAGDPPFLVSSFDLAYKELGWRPSKKLDQIIKSAWEWHKSHPNGYSK